MTQLTYHNDKVYSFDNDLVIIGKKYEGADTLVISEEGGRKFSEIEVAEDEQVIIIPSLWLSGLQKQSEQENTLPEQEGTTDGCSDVPGTTLAGTTD